MLKKVAIALAVVVVGLLALIASRPATYHVERSLVMPLPAATVFPLVNDYQARNSWYPWNKLDPNQKMTFSTPSSGEGAWYEWSGNDQVGKGKQTMTASTENARIEESLEFIEPFASTAKVSFTFTPKGEGTEVTWAMDGDNTFMGKAMSLVMSMDEMIGKDFENGLSALKADAENIAAAAEQAAKAAAEKEAAEKAAADAAAAAAPADGAAVPADGAAAEGG
jgi:hypothetical protein